VSKIAVEQMESNKTSLFGVFAVHSPESCPLNNEQSKKIFKEMKNKIESNISKFNVKRVVAFYMSVLEHEWIIILDAENAHDIEQLSIAVGISSYNTVKIVPLRYFDEVIKKLEG
jgi:translation initiation factor 6 (eIF-6)